MYCDASHTLRRRCIRTEGEKRREGRESARSANTLEPVFSLCQSLPSCALAMAAAGGALKEPYVGEDDSCDGHGDILDSEDEEESHAYEEEEGRREEGGEEEEEDFRATALGDHADPSRQVR